MRPPGSPEALERRRMRALTLLKEGLPPVEVARQLRIDRRSVRRWRARYRRRGLPPRPVDLPPRGRAHPSLVAGQVSCRSHWPPTAFDGLESPEAGAAGARA
jgi:hypothetical protein